MSAGLDLKLERGRIERGKDSLIVVLPSRAQVIYALGMTLWFGFAVLIIGTNVKKSDLLLALPVTLVFGTILGVGLMAFVLLLAWCFIGTETIAIHGDVLAHYRSLLGKRFGIETFSLKDVHEMQDDATGDVRPPTNGWPHIFGFIGGTIAFKYHRAIYRMGSRLGEGDARIIIENVLATTPLRVDELHDDPHEATVIERGHGILIEVPPARIKSVTQTSQLGLFVSTAMAAAGVWASLTGAAWDPMAMTAGAAFVAALIFYHGTALVTNLWRREIVAIDERRISIERDVLFLHFRTELDIVPEAKLWLDESYSGEAEMIGSYGRSALAVKPALNAGPIVYRGAGGRLFKFGNGLSKSEASFLVGRIHAKSPSLIS